MREGFTIENIWETLSTNVLDSALQVNMVRNWALRQGTKKLHQTFVEENEDQLPKKVQEMRAKALTNLLHTVNKALDDGRISPHVRKGIINDFIGQVLMGESDRQKPFREKYGFSPPSFVTISPTKRCNLKCTGCYAASSSKNANTLSYDVLQKIMDEKKEEWGSHFTVISGGEPLLYKSDGKDLFDLLHDNPDVYFMMYTNGTLITREVAKKMADAGNITPAISVEGWEKETDERRGKGVFKKIQQAMENLRAEGVPFGISVTATRYNAETVHSKEFMDYYFDEEGAIYGWIFQYMPIGRSYTIDLMVTPEQRKWMLERQMDLIYNDNRFLVDFWNGGPMSVGCIAGGRSGGYFYIDWDGNVTPCVFFPYRVGNVYDLYNQNKGVTDVLFSDLFKNLRQWQRDYANRQINGKCSDCSQVDNLFRPCPIRDHYDFAYEQINKTGAVPNDEDAEKALYDEDYRNRMKEYDQRLSELLDPMWYEKEMTS
jgi:radical SAM protein with 4Fe4S-binding SPASM domain